MPTPFGLEPQAMPMSDAGDTLSVEDLVDYCRTQSGLLAGRVETLAEETHDLLDEIDEDIAALRRRVAAHPGGTAEPTASPSTTGPDGAGSEMADLEEVETDIQEKQTIAEANKARLAAFQDLAAAYTELAEELRSTVDDRAEALDSVVRFERDHDAPAYFEDRQTVVEAAAESDGEDVTSHSDMA